MALQPSIILQGQQPDFINALARGQQAGAQATQIQRGNAMNALYAEQGPGILAGDPNALNALSRMDPQAALGVQQQGIDNKRADAQLGINQGNFEMRQKEFLMGVQQQAAQMDAAQRAAAAQEVQQGVFAASAAQTPQEWDEIVTRMGQTDLVGQFGQKESILRTYMTAAQILERDKGPDPAKPLTQVAKLKADLDAGLIDQATYQAAVQKSLAKTGMRIESDGKGGFSITQGDVGEQSAGLDPSSPEAMLNSIEGLLSDPALDTSTGILSPLQSIPGTSQKRVGTKIKQLDGQAFLRAFESLKGAGQITEIEGLKATQAIGRLDSSQSAKDYREALTELKDTLEAGLGRPPGWAEQQSATPDAPPQVSDEAGYNSLPSGTIFVAPDGTRRRKP